MAYNKLGRTATQDSTRHSSLDGQADEELMRELQAGNGEALTAIFIRYHRLVLVTAWRILRDMGEAEDLMQSVFFEIYRKAAQFDPAKGTLSKWILQYAYHRSINRKNYLTLRHFYEGVDRQSHEAEAQWIALASQPSQEAVQLASEALAFLNQQQRQIMELFFFGGLSLKEIAEQTKQTFVSVRHQYYRGLRRMRDHLTARRGRDQKPAMVALDEESRVNA